MVARLRIITDRTVDRFTFQMKFHAAEDGLRRNHPDVNAE